MSKARFEGVKLDFLEILYCETLHKISHLSEGEESYLFFIIKDYITTTMHLTAIPRKPVSLSVEFSCS